MEFSKTKEKVSYYDHDGFICNYIKYGDILRNGGDYHTHTNYEIIFIKMAADSPIPSTSLRRFMGASKMASRDPNFSINKCAISFVSFLGIA